jgi:hypothetical protein
VALLAAGLASPREAAAQLPPDAPWRTFDTPHFRVHFDPAVEGTARRAAERAERAHALLSEIFVEAPRGRIDLVVTDHVDASNGSAGVVPWRRIIVWAPPPVDVESLAYFDDWMDLVVTHEMVHIFHLERAGRVGRALRSVVGRPPSVWPLFPNRGLPGWIIEGIAVHYESLLTDGGRTNGTYGAMVARTAALHGTLETLDQVGGETPVWPAGQRSYLYGGLFMDHLARRHGPGAMGRFVRAVAGQWVPYRIDAAAREAFGESFSLAWEGWRAEVTREARALADSLASIRPLTVGEPLTREARNAVHAGFGPDGTLAFARADGRSEAQIRLLPPGDAGARGIRTNGLATFSWTPTGQLLVSQFETEGPYRIRRELTLVDPDGGTRPLTRGARLSWPHVHPGGEVAVAVQEGEGTNRLVLVDLLREAVEPLTPFRPDEHWAYPRWSPDGAWIAVSRWRPGGSWQLVLLRPDATEAWTITRDRALDTSPAWSPDGRWLLWSSDRTGIPNLFAVSVDPATGEPGPVRQVTHVVDGVAHPAVDPQGRWLVHSRYGPAGWDLERIPFDPSSWFDPLPIDPRFLEGGEEAAARHAAAESSPDRGYRALGSLLPRWWAPLVQEASTVGGVEVVGPRLGISTEGRDLVDRHRWQAEVQVEPREGRWEGGVGYGWAGLGMPLLGLSAGQSWDGAGAALARRQDGSLDTLYVVERERSLGASATLVRARARSQTSLTLSGRAIREELFLQDAAGRTPDGVSLARPTRSLGEVRLAAGVGTVRGYAFSVGPENGIGLTLQGRSRWEPGLADSARGVPGQDRGFDEAIGVVRLYRGLGGPGYAGWVLAARGAAGAGRGPGAGPFFFDLGGTSGRAESVTGLGLFGGSSFLFPLRGYPEGVRSGRYAWSGSLELRFPLAVIHRGVGPALLHADRLSGALFVDAGNAWGTNAGAQTPNPAGDPLVSGGAELVLTGTPFWFAPLDLRVGVSVPLVEGSGGEVYVRVGRSF